MPTFAYLLHATRPEMLSAGPTAEEAAAIEQHFSYLSALTAEGVMIFVGRSDTSDAGTFGIAVYRASSAAEAAQIMRDDPAVRSSVLAATLYPFRIVLQGAAAS